MRKQQAEENSQVKTNFKMLKWFKRPKKQDKAKASGEPLLKKVTICTQYTETTREKPSTDIPDQSGVSSDQIPKEIQVSKEEVLRILRKILSTKSNSHDLKNASEVIKQWGEQNGVTQKEGSYSQDWLCEFLQLVDESVEKHFHILPEDETQTSVQLEHFEDIICSKVHRLTPVLKDAGLLGYLTNSFSRQLFAKLDLIVHKDLSANETVLLLQWGKRVFFSPDYKDAFNVHDPILCTGWFERAKDKLLTVLKHDISRHLQNILCNEEEHDNDEINEEWFIRVHIDVTQYLSAAIQNANKVSRTLKHSVQILCLEELHCFAQTYSNGEKQHLQSLDTNFVYQCRIISTCMNLRCFAMKVGKLDNNKSADILKMLEEKVLSVVQKKIKKLAQSSITSCFKNGNKHIHNLMEEIQKLCAPLSQIEAAKEIQMIIVNLAYDCVCRVYLDCLIETDNFKQLERKWENVDESIREHIQIFQAQFTQMNCNVEKNKLLDKMSEVLFCSDVEALKLTCAVLYSDFPEESEHYLHGLLRWKRILSKQQVKVVLDVARPAQPSSTTTLISCLYRCRCYQK